MRPTLLVVALLSAACSAPSSWVLDRPEDTFEPTSSDNPGATESTAEQASALIGGAGGKVMTTGGSGVSIPARALFANVEITVAEKPDAPVPGDGSPVGPTFLFGPEGQRFDEPVTITVSFDPTKLDPGETAADIVIYTSPKENPSFVPVETTVVDATHVSAQATHFSYYGATHGALASGEYVSTASNIGESPYIGDWRDSGGYVLGYLAPGDKIYAQTVMSDSVYGLIPGSGYGAWDNGHHCGWVQLGKGTHIRGSGSHSSVAATCPAWNNDFSLVHGDKDCGSSCSGPGEKKGQDPTMFREGSWVVSDGEVQSAVVLPTCSDFTVYANYEPLTHTFSNPDGVEVASRGTVYSSTDFYTSASGVKATTGYSGFGTRFVSADGYAVEIKDTRRPASHGAKPSDEANGKLTAFGFMHADCIAGSQVGNPAGAWPPITPSCGTLAAGKSLGPTDEVMACGRQYWLSLAVDGKLIETEAMVGQVWDVAGQAGDHLDMQTDGNLVLYSGTKAIWATMTNGHPGAYLSVQDDGSLVVFYGATRLWSHQ
jgi:hypothetical protein